MSSSAGIATQAFTAADLLARFSKYKTSITSTTHSLLRVVLHEAECKALLAIQVFSPEQESSSQLNRKYPNKIREKAITMVDRRRTQNPRDRTIFREVAEHLEVGEQSLRLWVRHYDSERLGTRSKPGKTYGKPLPDNVTAELDALHRKIEKLQAENDVLKRAFVAFSAEWSK